LYLKKCFIKKIVIIHEEPQAGQFVARVINRCFMVQFALLAWLQAKPGMEQELTDLLKSALPLADAEPDTVTWYAWQIDDATFGIFDTFAAEDGREAHLNGKIAATLMDNADRLLAKPPLIEKLNILAAKG
jgi:quinol monooxygenase YgiN